MIKHQFTQGYTGTKTPVKDQTSITVPDQTLTVRELFQRHSKGMPLGTTELKGEYFDTEIPRFDDLTDMLRYKEELMSRNKEINRLIREEKKAVEAADPAASEQPSEQPPTEVVETTE